MSDAGTTENRHSAPNAADRPTHVRWQILALLMAIAALSHFNRIAISSAGTEHIIDSEGINRGYNIDKEKMGMVFSSYLFVYTLAMIPGGWLLDRIGPKRTLLIVGFGSVLFVPLTGVAAFIWPTSLLISLCWIRGVLGLVNAPIHPSAARAVSFWMPLNTRGVANGLVTGAAVTGIAVTPYVFGNMMSIMGWQWAFVASGLISLAVSVAWLIYGTDRPDQHPHTNQAERQLIANQVPASSQRLSLSDTLAGFASMFSNKSLVLVGLSYAAYSYVQYLFFYWQQQYFKDVLKLSNEESRLFPTIVNIFMVLGMVNGGWLTDQFQQIFGIRRGRAIAPMTGMLSCAVLLFLGIQNTNPWWVVGCFGLAMGALGLCEAPFWVTAVDLGGRRGGLSGAFLNTIGNVGGILGPLATPFLEAQIGWQAALGVAAAFLVAGAFTWLAVDPSHHTDEPVTTTKLPVDTAAIPQT